MDWKGQVQIKLENCSPDDCFSRAISMDIGMAFSSDGLERFAPGLEPARTGMVPAAVAAIVISMIISVRK